MTKKGISKTELKEKALWFIENKPNMSTSRSSRYLDALQERDSLRTQLAIVRADALREAADVDFEQILGDAETCMSGNLSRATAVSEAILALDMKM